MRTGATVVIGDHTQGLGITRSAALAGSPVWVVNDKYISLARFSRYLSGYKQVRRGTLSRLAGAEYAEHLQETLLELPLEGQAALFGVNEDITQFIYGNRDSLRPKYFIPEVRFESIYDKFVFNALLPEAARLDTRLCSEIDLGALDQAHRFMLKGRSGNAFRRITGQKAIPLSQLTPNELQRLFAQLAPDQVVLQEIVETTRPVLSVCTYSVHGKVKGLFGYEKLRQHPNRFGTGTYLRSASVDGVKPVAEQVLQRLDFTGISEIEFIHDPNGDAYRIIEMNPRPWKSIHFATQCEQNLVAQHLTYLSNGRMEARDHYLTGRYWADLATDIPQMFRERKIWRYHRGFFECTWDWSDPMPALILWALFPIIALESLLSARPNGSVDSVVQHAS
jgi:hypothetical protein